MGKSSAPPAPDYAAAAQAQGVANKETAQFNAGANRVNQIGPDYSLTWTIRPGADLNNPQPGDYVQTLQYTPERQAQQDANRRMENYLLDMAQNQLGRVNSTMGQPLDTSQLPGWYTSSGQVRTSGGQVQDNRNYTQPTGGMQGMQPRNQSYGQGASMSVQSSPSTNSTGKAQSSPQPDYGQSSGNGGIYGALSGIASQMGGQGGQTSSFGGSIGGPLINVNPGPNGNQGQAMSFGTGDNRAPTGGQTQQPSYNPNQITPSGPAGQNVMRSADGVLTDLNTGMRTWADGSTSQLSPNDLYMAQLMASNTPVGTTAGLMSLTAPGTSVNGQYVNPEQTARWMAQYDPSEAALGGSPNTFGQDLAALQGSAGAGGIRSGASNYQRPNTPMMTDAGVYAGYQGQTPFNASAYGAGQTTAQGLPGQNSFQVGTGNNAATGQQMAQYGGGGFGAGGVQGLTGVADDTSRRRVEQAILSRLEPQYQSDRSALRNQLVSQGLEVGSPGYQAEMARMDRAQEDARQQAILSGGQEETRQTNLNLAQTQMNAGLQQQGYNQGFQNAQFDNQTRQQMLAEMLMQRQLPLNELNALRTGTQMNVNLPGSYYTNNANAAPVFEGAQAQGAYNQSVAANNQSGFNSLLGTAGTLGAMYFMSDIRLKTNIKRTGKLPSGIGLYDWDWKDGSGSSSGVLAQEVQTIQPEAVATHPSGFLMVNYAALKV